MEAPLDFKGLTEFVEVAFDGHTGSLATALEEAISECTQKLSLHGGKAALKLTVSFAIAGSSMAVGAKVETVVPGPVALPSRLYVNNRGELILDDPKQLPLPFTGEVVKNDR